MNSLKELYDTLPRPVQIWTYTVLAALIYIIYRLFVLGGKEAFLFVDKAIALYLALGILIFLGFFMTRDPE